MSPTGNRQTSPVHRLSTCLQPAPLQLLLDIEHLCKATAAIIGLLTPCLNE